MYDVVIIGGGPAGASAAIYTARADLRTLVIDKGLTAGALGITSKISNYPGVPGTVSGAELVGIMRQQAESFGATFTTERVVGVDINANPRVVMGGTRTFQTRAIILATGSMGRTSTVPGEEKLLGRGVSYCATCDGAFFRNRPVAVVGGNDEALEETLFLSKFASHITLIVPTPEMKAQPHVRDEVIAHPAIDVRTGTRLKAVEGDKQVTGVRVQSRESKEDEVIPVEGVFVFLQGARPITDYLMGQLETTDDGCLKVDRQMQTSVPGIFAVGDLLCSHIKQAVIAASDGVIAAIAADRYIHGRKQIKTDWS
ncbi:MAG: FAD-dependent oxidoreductase [Chloroflexaceae bacterium]|nr:FAD-dependent oxidoreductase [Chloroflexaceae bacterium]